MNRYRLIHFTLIAFAVVSSDGVFAQTNNYRSRASNIVGNRPPLAGGMSINQQRRTIPHSVHSNQGLTPNRGMQGQFPNRGGFGNRGHRNRGHWKDRHHGNRGQSSVFFFTPFAYQTPYYYAPDYYYDPSAEIQAENDALRQQIQLLRQQNQQLGAARPAIPAPKAQPNRARFQQAMDSGTRLFRIGSYGRAADNFRQAAGHAPDDATPLFFQAQALFASGRYEEAVKLVKQGIELNPQWINVDFNIRSLYKDPDDLDRQAARLGARLQDNPLDRDGLFLLGFQLFMSGDKDRAQVLLSQVQRLEPDAEHLQPFIDFYQAAQ